VNSRLSESDLSAWGERIGREATTPLVLALRGDLGAGKTTLARAIARGAGVAGDIPSPTFNLVFRYETPRLTLQHLDLYRLESPDEVWELGWSELGTGNELVLIEWPDRAEALLPRTRWEVELVEGDDPSVREVSWHAVGDPSPLPPPEEA
jgi:tRNA threonylcarbamoyladenosine biosynthesis protein TsaE